ncbi:MAG: SIR2 family protein [Allorhizobium sp.]
MLLHIFIKADPEAEMWLIENANSRFLTESFQVSQASASLSQALNEHNLTFVVGNGLSQSAAWLHSVNNPSSEFRALSWSEVVRQAASPHYSAEFLNRCSNYLAIAQAVLIRSRDTDDARARLLDNLRTVFASALDTNAIDKVIVELARHDIVTTNYDFQIERALHNSSADSWMALVRTDTDYEESGRVTWVHKMHGSFAPAQHLRDKYRFPGAQPAEASIVITERDYDECFRDLSSSRVNYGLLAALKRPCLILGKSVLQQDISFVYALRASRSEGKARYVLLADPPSEDETIAFDNLGIKPLVLNMPRNRGGGHYYYAYLSALGRLFGGAIERIFREEIESNTANFADLALGPAVVAVGLAAKNVTGLARYNDSSVVLTAGRRNLAFLDSEEHLGGAALTALLVLSSLGKASGSSVGRSLVSSIGMRGDATAEEILKGCASQGIDTDAVSQNQKNSWHSTVLIHSSRAGAVEFEGQRIFLDRGYQSAVTLDQPEMDQFIAQLSNSNLQVLYLDKFLAAQHPPIKEASEVVESQFGPLLKPEVLDRIHHAIKERPVIDVLYETGGGGSQFGHVESRVKHLVNVFTASFPFFASIIMHDALTPRLAAYGRDGWWNLDFEHEIGAIDELYASSLIRTHLPILYARWT